MAQGDIPVTIVGNLTNDPELRFTPSGAAVASFTVASSTRVLDRQLNLNEAVLRTKVIRPDQR